MDLKKILYKMLVKYYLSDNIRPPRTLGVVVTPQV